MQASVKCHSSEQYSLLNVALQFILRCSCPECFLMIRITNAFKIRIVSFCALFLLFLSKVLRTADFVLITQTNLPRKNPHL